MHRLVEYVLVVSHASPLRAIDSDKEHGRKMVFETAVVDRYPFEDHDGMPLPPGVALFCIPEGIEMKAQPELPRFHCFATTIANGERIYGYCLEFYESVHPDTLIEAEQVERHISLTTITEEESSIQDSRRMSSSPNISKVKMYAPKSIVILSRWMFLNQFKEYLTQLYRVTITPHKIPIERYLCNLVHEIPIPPKGVVEVETRIANLSITFSRPPSNHPILFTNFPFMTLFMALSSETVIELVEALLMEQQILLLSEHYSLLVAVSEGLCALLYPFYWNHVYIPLLPRSLLDFLCAPMPFLIGTITSYITRADMIPSTVLIVDLDKNETRSNFKVPQIPPKERQKLTKTIKALDKFRNASVQVHAMEFKKLDLAFNYAPSPDEVIGNEEQEQLPLREFQIRAAFLRVYTSLLRNYRNFLSSPSDISFDPDNIFNRPGFLNSHHSGSSCFLKLLLDSSHFDEFIRTRCFESDEVEDVIFFDESVIEKMNRATFAKKKPTPFLDTEHGQIHEKYIATEPDISGIDRKGFPSCERFPKFNPDFFYIPRATRIFLKNPNRLKTQSIMHSPQIDRKSLTETQINSLICAIWFSFFFKVIMVSKDQSILEDAFQVLKEALAFNFAVDPQIYQKMIDVCGVCGCPQKCLDIVELMQRHDIWMDAAFYSSVRNVCPNSLALRRALHEGILSQRRRASSSIMTPLIFRKSSSRANLEGFNPNLSTFRSHNSLKWNLKVFPQILESLGFERFEGSCSGCKISQPIFESISKWEDAFCSVCQLPLAISLIVQVSSRPGDISSLQLPLLHPLDLHKETSSLFKSVDGLFLSSPQFCSENAVIFWSCVWHFFCLNLPMDYILLCHWNEA